MSGDAPMRPVASRPQAGGFETIARIRCVNSAAEATHRAGSRSPRHDAGSRERIDARDEARLTSSARKVGRGDAALRFPNHAFGPGLPDGGDAARQAARKAAAKRTKTHVCRVIAPLLN